MEFKVGAEESTSRLSENNEKHDLSFNIKNSKVATSYGQRWDFNNFGDLEGWTVSRSLRGAVSGGALWLTMQGDPDRRDCTYLAQMFIKGTLAVPNPAEDIASPKGLSILASKVKKIRMRVLNLSPETDLFIDWRTEDDPDKNVWIEGKSSIWGTLHLAMKPYHREWQEVVCHVDDLWTGTIDQIRFRPVMKLKGDIWIDWIAITEGKPRPCQIRPDVASERVVPKMSIPRISQRDFREAFKVLDECLFTDVPIYGFEYPFMGPGGTYGECWWQFDTNLNIAGAKWANQEFAEGVIRGFIGVQKQNPDGRIDLMGLSVVRCQPADVSSMPWYFEAAYDVARRTGDAKLRETIYESMKDYLAWWLSPVKRDDGTGLITCTSEETHGEPMIELPASVAPIDLNVLVAIGCHNAAILAHGLGKSREAETYQDAFIELSQAINQYMWSEADSVYYNYNVREGKPIKRLLSTTFNPLRLGIAPPDRVERLIPKLLDPVLFNWGVLPVTSLAKTESGYKEVIGTYTGSQANPWYGCVWTMRNRSVIAGLQDAGKHALAAELAWATIKAFNANYREWLVPSTGSGQGVQRYGFSASQYIQIMIEHLFGVDYDRSRERLRIMPHVPVELMGYEISIRELILPMGSDVRLSLIIKQVAEGEAYLAVELVGKKIPDGDVDILFPQPIGKTWRVTDERGNRLPIVEQPEGLVNVGGVRMAMKSSIELHFKLSLSPVAPFGKQE